MTQTEIKNEERRETQRLKASARFMIKIGFDDGFYYYGTVRNVSAGGVLVEADIRDMVARSTSVSLYQGTPVILVGAEKFNRHFSLSATIVHITKDWDLGLKITSTTNDEFLQAWATP